MKSDPWLKEGDTRKLAEERHKDNQSASTSVCGHRNKICNHEHTTKSLGWRICMICGLCLERVFSQDLNSYLDRCSFSNVKKDKRKEIRDKMDELIDAIVREHSVCWYTGERFYTVPPEAGGLPYEFFDYSKELCQTCYDYKLDDDNVFKKVKRGSPIHCQARSLCAAVLWEKVKSLYPMTLDEFVKKVGVSKLTITNTCKKMKQKDSAEY
jgi:hypothetical protein